MRTGGASKFGIGVVGAVVPYLAHGADEALCSTLHDLRFLNVRAHLMATSSA